MYVRCSQNNAWQGVSYIQADIRDAQALEDALMKQQTTDVIHLAAIIDSRNLALERFNIK